MAKSKTKSKPQTGATRKSSAIPLPPVIYINDGVSVDTPHHAFPFYKLLPKFSYAPVTQSTTSDTITELLESTKAESAIALFISTHPSGSNHVEKTADTIKQSCIVNGRNFLSVNFYPHGSLAPKAGTAQHLNFAIKNHTHLEAAKEVLKWMFQTLAPIETVHLIPASDFLATDTTNFPDYVYSAISASRTHAKDAKVQFVAVITAKAVVSAEGNKLTWSVADKTGVANFYFVHKGVGSQYTWDWVLKLQPGQRVALPRMPCVEVKERWEVRVAKVPVRVVGFGLVGVGMGLAKVGNGVGRVGRKVCWGKASRWVPRDEVAREREGGEAVKREWDEKRLEGAGGEEDVGDDWSVFNEKGRLAWGSEDEDAKTEKGSVCGREPEKEV